MFRLNGSKDIFKQHILSSQMDDCLPCENFCPFKSKCESVSGTYILCHFLVDEIVLMVLMEKINVNVKAVNIDNVPKRRQTLSLFSQVRLKDAIT